MCGPCVSVMVWVGAVRWKLVGTQLLPSEKSALYSNTNMKGLPRYRYIQLSVLLNYQLIIQSKWFNFYLYKLFYCGLQNAFTEQQSKNLKSCQSFKRTTTKTYDNGFYYARKFSIKYNLFHWIIANKFKLFCCSRISEIRKVYQLGTVEICAQLLRMKIRHLKGYKTRTQRKPYSELG